MPTNKQWILFLENMGVTLDLTCVQYEISQFVKSSTSDKSRHGQDIRVSLASEGITRVLQAPV